MVVDLNIEQEYILLKDELSKRFGPKKIKSLELKLTATGNPTEKEIENIVYEFNSLLIEQNQELEEQAIKALGLPAYQLIKELIINECVEQGREDMISILTATYNTWNQILNNDY